MGKKKADSKNIGEEHSLQRGEHKGPLDAAKHTDLGYYITKYSLESRCLLACWTGYNQRLANNVPPKAIIACLRVVYASPTDLNTVNTILHRSIDIASSLQLDAIVVVVHQAIYTKAQAMRWQTPLLTDSIVIRLGAFHITMALLVCIGKRFQDAGLEYILIESQVLAPG